MKNYELLFLVQDILLTIQPNNNGLTAKEISTVTNTPIEHINIAIGRLSLDDKMIITHEGTNGSPTKYTLDSRGRNAITSQHYKIKAETEEMIYNSFEAQKLAASKADSTEVPHIFGVPFSRLPIMPVFRGGIDAVATITSHCGKALIAESHGAISFALATRLGIAPFSPVVFD